MKYGSHAFVKPKFLSIEQAHLIVEVLRHHAIWIVASFQGFSSLRERLNNYLALIEVGFVNLHHTLLRLG